MPDWRPRQLIAIPEFALDRDQVLDLHPRRERLAAAPALCLLALAPDFLVERHTDLGRALEDVEELAERQPEESENHRDRVQDREKIVGVAFHPRVTRG